MSDRVADMGAGYLAVDDAGSVVPEGYKQTEVGVIPEDWCVSSIDERHKLATGNTPSTADLKNYGYEHLFVSPADLGKSKYICKTEKMLSKKGYGISRKYPAGSTLFTCIGSTIGKTGLATIELSSNQQINAVFPNEEDNSEFTFYALTFVAPKIKILAGEQAVPLVNKTDFGATLYCLPSTKKEQTAIANALSDVDALISEQEKLIAKKQAIKTATMQQLLTGRTRLPQFALREDGTVKGYKQSEVGLIPDDWATPRFGEVCKLINGRGFKPHEWSTEGLPIIRIQNLNGSDDFNYFEGRYDPKIFVQKNQLLFAWSGSRGTSFGPHVWRGDDALLNYHTWKLVVNEEKVEEHYFFHILKILTKEIEDSAHGASALVHTQKGEMEQIFVPIPTLEAEQVAIAEVLTDIDCSIEELRCRLTKTRQIKQGMMQELLTGKTRLVKSEQVQ